MLRRMKELKFVPVTMPPSSTMKIFAASEVSGTRQQTARNTSKRTWTGPTGTPWLMSMELSARHAVLHSRLAASLREETKCSFKCSFSILQQSQLLKRKVNSLLGQHSSTHDDVSSRRGTGTNVFTSEYSKNMKNNITKASSKKKKCCVLIMQRNQLCSRPR